MPIFIYFAYGQLFMRSFWVFVILCPGIIALSITRISNTTFTQTGRPIMKSYVRSLGLLVNISTLFLFIKTMSVYGLALSISLSYFVMMFASLKIMDKYFKIKPIDLFKFDITTIKNFIALKSI